VTLVCRTSERGERSTGAPAPQTDEGAGGVGGIPTPTE